MAAAEDRAWAAVAAWAQAVGVQDGWTALDLFVHYFDRMPPMLLRVVGERLTPAQRAAVPRVRERRRRFATLERPTELSAGVQREKQSNLWYDLVASAEGEEDSDDDEPPAFELPDRGRRHASPAAKATPPGSPKLPQLTPQPDETDDLFTKHDALRALHAAYLRDVDGEPPVDPGAAPHLVAAFDAAVVRQFETGHLDVPGRLYECDYEERWDVPTSFTAQREEEAWFDDEEPRGM